MRRIQQATPTCEQENSLCDRAADRMTKNMRIAHRQQEQQHSSRISGMERTTEQADVEKQVEYYIIIGPWDLGMDKRTDHSLKFSMLFSRRRHS